MNKKANRVRNKTLAFHLSENEYAQIQARIAVCGMAKGEYVIQSLLNQKIIISGGKFQSDRLAVEIKKLRKFAEEKTTEENNAVLNEIKCLLEQLRQISDYNLKLSAEDFKTKPNIKGEII